MKIFHPLFLMKNSDGQKKCQAGKSRLFAFPGNVLKCS